MSLVRTTKRAEWRCMKVFGGSVGAQAGSWVVVSVLFNVQPYMGKIPILTNNFQLG